MEYNVKVIDSFEIKKRKAKGTDRKERLFDLTIIFKKCEEFFAESTYKRVPIAAIGKIERMLKDNIGYNKTVNKECEAVALPTLIFLVEDIIGSKKK